MRTITALILCTSFAAAATPPKKTAKPAQPAVRKAAAAAAARKPAPPAVTVPANATRVDENTWTHTDPQGKTWTYRQTPFGLQKSEATTQPNPFPLPEATRDRQSPFSAEGTPALPSATAAEEVSVTESGESITFQRKTPFGNNRWTKKKSEMTAEERALLERAKTQ